MIILKNFTIRLLFISLLSSLCFVSVSQDVAEGEKIFKNVCKACHNLPGGGMSTGPDLKDVLNSEKFVNQEDPTETFIKYVQNPLSLGVKAMPAQDLDDTQVLSVLEFINTYVPEQQEVSSNEEIVVADGMSSVNILLIIFIILVIFIIALISIKNTLKKIQDQKTETISESIINFCKVYWANSKAVLVTSFILFIFVLKIIFDTMMGIGVVEGYQPEQPIQFSHKIHAGVNGIDCNYCHASARHSKTASVPSADLCMNCHTQIKTGTITGETEINKIYDAVGFNPETGKYIKDYQQKPIEWVRVHKLPDLSYFNHSQHVNVAGLECQQCHGNVEEKTVGQVAFKDELNKVQKNQDEGIKFKHPTLTMGWCIDCHRTKEIDMESNEYYADMHEKLKSDPKYKDKKITPALIGGMECGKCHY